MTKHYFNIDVAKEVGINAAIVFQNLAFWIGHNEEKNLNFHDGKYWTFNSVETMKANIPYMTANQIRLSLQKLKDAEYIITGNYNRMKYDKTLWYSMGERGIAFVEKEKSVCEKTQMENAKTKPGVVNFQKPIPDDKKIYKIKNIDPDKVARIRKLCGIS